MYVYITFPLFKASCTFKYSFAFIYIFTIIYFFRDLVAELPFTLMHPKPEEDPLPNPSSRRNSKDVGNNVPVDTNLIQLDG